MMLFVTSVFILVNFIPVWSFFILFHNNGRYVQIRSIIQSRHVHTLNTPTPGNHSDLTAPTPVHAAPLTIYYYGTRSRNFTHNSQPQNSNSRSNTSSSETEANAAARNVRACLARNSKFHRGRSARRAGSQNPAHEINLKPDIHSTLALFAQRTCILTSARDLGLY